MMTNNIIEVVVVLEIHIKFRILVQHQGRHKFMLIKSVLTSGQSTAQKRFVQAQFEDFVFQHKMSWWLGKIYSPIYDMIYIPVGASAQWCI